MSPSIRRAVLNADLDASFEIEELGDETLTLARLAKLSFLFSPFTASRYLRRNKNELFNAVVHQFISIAKPLLSRSTISDFQTKNK
jgi:hypothetical protein